MKCIRKRQKAFSLAEVVVSLGVAATTMVVAISMTTQSLRLAKENEIENTANEIVVQTLELVKSPAPLNIIPPLSGNVTALVGAYKLNRTSGPTQGPETGIASLEAVSPFVEEINAENCKEGTQQYDLYKVELPELNVVMCNQIIFKQQLDEEGTYSIILIVVYEIGGEKVVEKVEVFRRGNFNIINNR